MTRAAVYGRVSTTEQANEGYSIDAQLEKGKAYANLSDWAVADVYRDAGISGSLSLGERPEGARLLKAAKSGEFDVVIFTKIDRFARTVRKALEDFETLGEYGVEVVFVEEKIDTTTAQGRMFRSLLLVFAEFEREQIRDRNMAGRYAKAASGSGWASGAPPYGYRIDDDGLLEVVPEEADVIRFMFRQRAQGKSLREVAKAANDRGYTPRARRDSRTGEVNPHTFGSGSVQQYLRNTAYKGDPIIRNIAPSDGAPSEPFEFPAPPIVAVSLWESANAVALSKSKGGGKGRGDVRTYALKGRVWHRHGNESEATMFGQARKTADGVLRWYRCTDSRHNTKRDLPATCDGFGMHYGQSVTSVQADYIEAAALVWVLDQLADPSRLEELIAEADRAEVGTEADDSDDLRIRLADINAKVTRWTEQYAEGLVDRKTRDERIAALRAEADAVERELARAQAHDARVEGVVLSIEDLLAWRDPGFEDWATEEIPRGSAQWWAELRSAASKTLAQTESFGRFETLPEWVIEETRYLANLLDIHVILQRSDDPKRPSVRISFAPSALADLGSVESTAYSRRGNNQMKRRDVLGPSTFPDRIEDWAIRPAWLKP